VEGNDALTRVESQFNQMADAVTSLLDQLRQHRANLEKVMNSVDDGMVVLDRERTIVAANDAFARRFPELPGNLIGRSCCGEGEGGGVACLSEGDCPAQMCFASEAVQTVIRKRRSTGGAERTEEIRASPVYGDDGKAAYVVEVWRDITDRRSAEAQLAEYQRLVSLGMLASGFSHEVNTPLASISTCLDGIKRTCAEGEALAGEGLAQVREYARIAATQVQRCGAITQQFLRLARGKTLAREAVDLRATAEVVARLAEHTAREAGVAIEVAGAGDLPAVIANESAVQQVLLNLVLNAVEASDKGQRVRIAFNAGDCVQVKCQDQGKGIAPEDIARVFEPFFSRRERGTGLGLFVSLGLARGWGGDILVDSALGSGSTFTVIFPLPGRAEASRDGAA
jgi:signal transduction histidine kinase